MEILECVPNVSEGRDTAIITHLAHVISSVPQIQLLHVDSGYAANRTVYTFIGPAKQVLEAAFLLFSEASRLISMKSHMGEHPRIGVVDVCPLIPVSGITLEKAIFYSKELAKRIGECLQIPIYLYEESAIHPDRKKLEQIRKGEYEGFTLKIQMPEWKPDFGPLSFNPETGVCVIGARKFLLAYNVNLETKDVQIAKNIAVQIRESGGTYISYNGKTLKSNGLLQGVKAIGWYLNDYKVVQVSTNITDYSETSLFTVFNEVSKLAKLYKTKVTGSEIIGLIPLEAIELSAKEMFEQNYIEQVDINLAIEKLNLSDIKEFNPNEHILEKIAKLI